MDELNNVPADDDTSSGLTPQARFDRMPDGFIAFNPRMLSRLLNAPSSDNCTCDLTESLQEFSHKLMKGDRNSKGGALEMTGWMPECRMQTIPECFPNAECKHSPNAFPDALSRNGILRISAILRISLTPHSVALFYRLKFAQLSLSATKHFHCGAIHTALL